MTAKNDCCTWDNTLSAKHHTKEDIEAWLQKWCKKWCFQLEKGSQTGYEHYQLRCSLKVKCSNMTMHLKPSKWSVTSKENRTNLFYVMKDDTRLEGPWTENDIPLYIPRQVREIMDTLYPWQIEVREKSKKWDTRSINIIYDQKGKKGKSALTTYMAVMRLARVLPYCNNYKDVMRMSYCLDESSCYIIDIPRGIKKSELRGLFAAIEELKNGHCFDDRYEYKERYFDSPCIWVFTNKLPNPKYLSDDRWKYYQINCNMELRKYIPSQEDFPKKKKVPGRS